MQPRAPGCPYARSTREREHERVSRQRQGKGTVSKSVRNLKLLPRCEARSRQAAGLKILKAACTASVVGIDLQAVCICDELISYFRFRLQGRPQPHPCAAIV